MAFSKITVHKRSEYVIDQILHAIQTGQYQVGDKLPPERALAEMMGVSRPAIREALSVLQIAGIVESRHGDGTYITTTADLESFQARIAEIVRENHDPFEVLEARMAFEEGVAQLAAQKATLEHLAVIKAALEGMRKALAAADYERYFAMDRAFHIAIAEATHNTLIISTIQSLVKAMAEPLWRTMKPQYLYSKSLGKAALREHEAIFQAIQQRSPAAISQAIRTHLTRSKARFLAAEEDE